MSTSHFTGEFTPLPVMEEKAYPRLVGPGYLAIDDEGITVMGHGVDLVNPTSARLRLAFWLGSALLLGWLLGAIEVVMGITLGLLTANAVREYTKTRQPELLHSTLTWPDVDRVQTDGQRVILFAGSMVLFGSPIPNPVVFSPEDDAEALGRRIQEHLETTERSKTLHVLK